MNTLLSQYGVDLTSMIAALIGCIVVQTLLPRKEVFEARQIVLLTLGSVLFASLANPLAFAWVLHNHAELIPLGQEMQVRAATAAALGGFAQPILTGIRALADRFLASRLKD